MTTNFDEIKVTNLRSFTIIYGLCEFCKNNNIIYDDLKNSIVNFLGTEIYILNNEDHEDDEDDEDDDDEKNELQALLEPDCFIIRGVVIKPYLLQYIRTQLYVKLPKIN